MTEQRRDSEPGSRPRIGVVGVPGGWSSELLADTVAERTGFRLLVDMARVRFDVTAGRVLFEGVDLCELDGLIIKKAGAWYDPGMLDRLDVLRYVSDQGVRVFSHPRRIMRVLDRLFCTVTLRQGDIPMPPTVVTEDLGHAEASVREFGEAVVKPLYSTKARGMMVLSADDAGLAGTLREYQEGGQRFIYIQKKLQMPDRDLGVVFLGGEYIGTYARVAGGDSWNTTIRAGGKYAKHEPSQEIIDLAHKAQALFGLDFTSVDVVELDDGPVIFEVSAFGGFRGLRDGLGVDAAARYTEYAIAQIGADRG